MDIVKNGREIRPVAADCLDRAGVGQRPFAARQNGPAIQTFGKLTMAAGTFICKDLFAGQHIARAIGQIGAIRQHGHIPSGNLFGQGCAAKAKLFGQGRGSQ